jgi:hypothetical protein
MIEILSSTIENIKNHESHLQSSNCDLTCFNQSMFVSRTDTTNYRRFDVTTKSVPVSRSSVTTLVMTDMN